MTKAYLLGVLHDATERKTTFRIVQKSKAYIDFLAEGMRSLGQKAWINKGGKDRNLWVVEFSKFFLKDAKVQSRRQKIDYIRGYFDTDGGVARSPRVRYYLYFAQKDLSDLQEVKSYLKELGIACGKIHNPSSRIDPNYWRFFIRAKSYDNFAKIVGSWHPIKRHFLRMKR